jgi:hypothetical protein
MITYSMLVFGGTDLLMPLAQPGWRVALFAAGWAGFSFSAILYNIAQLSYRQTICPPELYGRVNATIRWMVWGTLPLGGLLGGVPGGVLGTVAGVRVTVWIGWAGAWAAGWWVFLLPAPPDARHPLRRRRHRPRRPAPPARPRPPPQRPPPPPRRRRLTPSLPLATAPA